MKLNFESSVFYTAEYQQDIAIKSCTCNYTNGYVFLQDVCIHSNSSIENSFHSPHAKKYFCIPHYLDILFSILDMHHS